MRQGREDAWISRELRDGHAYEACSSPVHEGESHRHCLC